jgi:predicted membrane protein
MDTATLLWGLLFASVGIGFFVYGKRQKAIIPLICGLLLIVLPYLISNTVLLIFLGIVLILVPYFIRY